MRKTFHSKGTEKTMTIDELFQTDEYDIYNNANLKEENLEKIANILAENKRIDLEKYLNLKACSNKFCWNNFISVIEKLPYEDKFRGIPILFELLQDANWPVFQHAVSALEQFGKETLTPYIEKYMQQAHAEKDDMWIENIQLLADKMNQ